MPLARGTAMTSSAAPMVRQLHYGTVSIVKCNSMIPNKNYQIAKPRNFYTSFNYQSGIGLDIVWEITTKQGDLIQSYNDFRT